MTLEQFSALRNLDRVIVTEPGGFPFPGVVVGTSVLVGRFKHVVVRRDGGMPAIQLTADQCDWIELPVKSEAAVVADQPLLLERAV